MLENEELDTVQSPPYSRQPSTFEYDDFPIALVLTRASAHFTYTTDEQYLAHDHRVAEYQHLRSQHQPHYFLSLSTTLAKQSQLTSKYTLIAVHRKLPSKLKYSCRHLRQSQWSGEILSNFIRNFSNPFLIQIPKSASVVINDWHVIFVIRTRPWPPFLVFRASSLAVH